MSSRTILISIVFTFGLIAFVAVDQFNKSRVQEGFPLVNATDAKAAAAAQSRPAIEPNQVQTQAQPQLAASPPVAAGVTYVSSTPPPLSDTNSIESDSDNAFVSALNLRSIEQTTALIYSAIGITIANMGIKSTEASSLPGSMMGGMLTLAALGSETSALLVFDKSTSLDSFLIATGRSLGFTKSDLQIDLTHKILGCGGCVIFKQSDSESNYGGFYVKNPYSMTYYFYRMDLAVGQGIESVLNTPPRFSLPNFNACRANKDYPNYGQHCASLSNQKASCQANAKTCDWLELN